MAAQEARPPNRPANSNNDSSAFPNSALRQISSWPILGSLIIIGVAICIYKQNFSEDKENKWSDPGVLFVHAPYPNLFKYAAICLPLVVLIWLKAIGQAYLGHPDVDHRLLRIGIGNCHILFVAALIYWGLPEKSSTWDSFSIIGYCLMTGLWAANAILAKQELDSARSAFMSPENFKDKLKNLKEYARQGVIGNILVTAFASYILWYHSWHFAGMIALHSMNTMFSGLTSLWDIHYQYVLGCDPNAVDLKLFSESLYRELLGLFKTLVSFLNTILLFCYIGWGSWTLCIIYGLFAFSHLKAFFKALETTRKYLRRHQQLQKNFAIDHASNGIEEKCPICLEVLKTFIRLRCNHCYHQCCLMTMMNNERSKCALCEKLILGEDEDAAGAPREEQKKEERKDKTKEEAKRGETKIKDIKSTKVQDDASNQLINNPKQTPQETSADPRITKIREVFPELPESAIIQALEKHKDVEQAIIALAESTSN